jgi:DNA primase
MLRASRLAAQRNLELRVVPLPDGTDPAGLLSEAGGLERLRALVETSKPFAVFHVERILDHARLDSAEGRDRAVQELAAVLDKLDASALRDDLIRTVAGRLELPEGRLEARIAAAADGGAIPDAPATHGAQDASVDPAVRTERDFLVLCLALPQPGRQALRAIDPDVHLTSEPLRRAARHLAGQPELPFTGLAGDDEQLARIVAALVDRAGALSTVTAEQIEQQRLMLELSRLDRAIARARAESPAALVSLAQEREEVLGAIHEAGRLLEQAG